MITPTTDVAIIGAGPYGLSLAAHLRQRGVAFRIFGPPMHNWRECMPVGMRLKSDGFASNLYDPQQLCTLKGYCAEHGIEYDDLRIPVRLDTFVDYGLAFQARMVPNLEKQPVIAVKADGGLFDLQLQSGDVVRARRVVVATGISHFDSLPRELESLAPQWRSHSSAHRDLSGFRGKRVIVVGGGASAIDIAALLHAEGTHVQIASRHPVTFSGGPGDTPSPLWQRIRHPHFGLGSSLRSTIYTLFPNLFHYLPLKLRARIVRRHLGPFGGWFMKPQVEGLIAIHEGYAVRDAQVVGGEVHLQLANPAGRTMELRADHVIAATGYKTELSRLPFLDPAVLSRIRLEVTSPKLSSNFESAVPGLYFTGLAAALSFGPLLRFALGAEFCARRLARHLARSSVKGDVLDAAVVARSTE
jgi:cation diffusion facilitator CzcD-associated flavoprotein CzcO